MLARITGAAMRGILVAFLIAMPSLLLPNFATDSAEIVALMALLGGILTFAEYYSNFPSFIEFREAPPLNRMRFISLLVTIGILSLMARHPFEPTGLTTLIHGMGSKLGNALDFSYSPVHLVTLIMPPHASAETVSMVRAAAGLAYVIGLISVAVFFFTIHIRNWPVANGAFNVWVNLPLFDPTTGGDVVHRLQRDGRINLIFGVLLPFAIPAAVSALSAVFDPAVLSHPQTLVWMIGAWGFLPTSLVMRGMAMLRVAELIEQKRRRAYANAEAIQTA
ncbi:hypothetical protein [Parasedimentitalea huanghaiensis]|uniref:Uncharacterized protein n=1 Tax=Parasedimentitalea huanghaiensis TaxID=2682100 RepID=A0A6L6WDR9_9RHOB|nr:hypothetical protein [Zongyanglinia huanghaiensis]